MPDSETLSHAKGRQVHGVFIPRIVGKRLPRIATAFGEVFPRCRGKRNVGWKRGP